MQVKFPSLENVYLQSKGIDLERIVSFKLGWVCTVHGDEAVSVSQEGLW